MMNYVQSRCESSFAIGYEKGLKVNSIKSFAKGFLVGLLTMLGGIVLWRMII